MLKEFVDAQSEHIQDNVSSTWIQPNLGSIGGIKLVDGWEVRLSVSLYYNGVTDPLLYAESKVMGVEVYESTRHPDIVTTFPAFMGFEPPKEIQLLGDSMLLGKIEAVRFDGNGIGYPHYHVVPFRAPLSIRDDISLRFICPDCHAIMKGRGQDKFKCPKCHYASVLNG